MFSNFLTISSFPLPNVMAIFGRRPLVASNASVLEKVAIFDQYLAVSRKQTTRSAEFKGTPLFDGVISRKRCKIGP